MTPILFIIVQEALDKPNELMSDRKRIGMRRALASLLLAWFSFPLILPMLRADAASNLPSCCRRLGKHHCSIEGSMDAPSEESASGPTLKALQARCSNYPATSVAPGYENFAFLKDSPSICAFLLSYPSLQARAEAQYRVSFSRSRQKRGPPSLLA
jgi:hypothetical protein